MAHCLQISTSVAPPNGGAATTLINGVATMAPLPWVVSTASLVDGEYSCASGTYLLLTVQEVNDISSAPSSWTATDGLTVGWSVLGIWISVAIVMFFAKIIWEGIRDASES